jgi:hypothetical protein
MTDAPVMVKTASAPTPRLPAHALYSFRDAHSEQSTHSGCISSPRRHTRAEANDAARARTSCIQGRENIPKSKQAIHWSFVRLVHPKAVLRPLISISATCSPSRSRVPSARRRSSSRQSTQHEHMPPCNAHTHMHALSQPFVCMHTAMCIEHSVLRLHVTHPTPEPE